MKRQYTKGHPSSGLDFTIISSKPIGAGRCGMPQTPSAPLPQLMPPLGPISFQTSLPRSPVSGGNLKSGCGHVQPSREPGCLRDISAACAPNLGPRWILFIAILAAGVLVVSCLLCVICYCCHRQRHRKQPKDKETVGLGSARNSTTTHLVRSRNPNYLCPTLYWLTQGGGCKVQTREPKAALSGLLLRGQR